VNERYFSLFLKAKNRNMKNYGDAESQYEGGRKNQSLG